MSKILTQLAIFSCLIYLILPLFVNTSVEASVLVEPKQSSPAFITPITLQPVTIITPIQISPVPTTLITPIPLNQPTILITPIQLTTPTPAKPTTPTPKPTTVAIPPLITTIPTSAITTQVITTPTITASASSLSTASTVAAPSVIRTGSSPFHVAIFLAATTLIIAHTYSYFLKKKAKVSRVHT